MNQMRASEIREILKVAVSPEMISLAGGLPAPESFPLAAIATTMAELLASEGASALQYSTTEGDAELRAAIAERLGRRFAIATAPERILVTTGSQQGLDLIGKIFLDPGDVVLCESPTYLGAINAFRCYQPRFVEVATDDDGMELADLARCLAANPGAKLLYAVPDFQNPSGRCWSRERRAGVLALARRYRLAVVEDAPYAELRYSGEPQPPLAALDDDDTVLYLGSFSKVFCPGLRVGWVSGAEAVVEKLVLAKQAVDLHTPSLTQRLIARYLRVHDLDRAIEGIRALYRERRDAMLASLERELPEGVRFTRPAGGLFVWLELPVGCDARELLAACLAERVAFVPGGSFFPNGGHDNTARLNFSAMPPERLAEGVTRLARALRRLQAAAVPSVA
jgi:DNA-binding transcriptional MocR family regulator